MSTRTRARAANYNRLATIISQSITQDSFGQEQRAWVAGQTIYVAKEAEYRPTDVFVETSAAHHYEQKIWFRTRQGVTLNQTTMRLRDDEGDFEILTIEPDTINREIRILCRKVKP